MCGQVVFILKMIKSPYCLGREINATFKYFHICFKVMGNYYENIIDKYLFFLKMSA